MPIVNISLLEGREPKVIKACIKAVARSVHETLGVPLNTIRVIATIIPAQYWAVGTRTKDEIDVVSSEEVAEEVADSQ